MKDMMAAKIELPRIEKLGWAQNVVSNAVAMHKGDGSRCRQYSVQRARARARVLSRRKA